MSDHGEQKARELSRTERIAKLVADLERAGCSCDLMYGVHCDIHRTVRELRAELGIDG